MLRLASTAAPTNSSARARCRTAADAGCWSGLLFHADSHKRSDIHSVHGLAPCGRPPTCGVLVEGHSRQKRRDRGDDMRQHGGDHEARVGGHARSCPGPPDPGAEKAQHYAFDPLAPGQLPRPRRSPSWGGRRVRRRYPPRRPGGGCRPAQSPRPAPYAPARPGTPPRCAPVGPRSAAPADAGSPTPLRPGPRRRVRGTRRHRSRPRSARTARKPRRSSPKGVTAEGTWARTRRVLAVSFADARPGADPGCSASGPS